MINFSYLLLGSIISLSNPIISLHHYSKGIYDSELLKENNEIVYSLLKQNLKHEIQLYPYPSYPSKTLQNLVLNCPVEVDFCIETHLYVIRESTLSMQVIFTDHFNQCEIELNISTNKKEKYQSLQQIVENIIRDFYVKN